MIKKTLSFLIIFSLFFQQIGFAQVASQLDISGLVSSTVSKALVDKYRPVHLRSMSFDATAAEIRLLLDKGDNGNKSEVEIEEETKELVRYFFIGLSIPNEEFWVNLRPNAKESVLEEAVSKTEIGKILLETDIQLKKDVAGYTNPTNYRGKEYWNKLYKKAEELYASSKVTIPTLTRPWIVPNEIIVRESKEGAYVYKATLKVMLEEDYLKGSDKYSFKTSEEKQLNEYAAKLIREEIIPQLTKEINSSKRYAKLRQVYYSLILAQWYKEKYKNTTHPYAKLIDQKDLKNLESKEKWNKESYFKEYEKSFKEGEYNLQENVITSNGQCLRSYLSGGIGFTELIKSNLTIVTNSAKERIFNFLAAVNLRGNKDNFIIQKGKFSEEKNIKPIEKNDSETQKIQEDLTVDGGYPEDFFRIRSMKKQTINAKIVQDASRIRKSVEEYNKNILQGNDIFEFNLDDFIDLKEKSKIKKYFVKKSVDFDDWKKQVGNIPLLVYFSNEIPAVSNFIAFPIKEMIKNSYDSIQAMYDEVYYLHVAKYGVEENKQKALARMYSKDARTIKLQIDIEDRDNLGECLVIKVEDNGLGVFAPDTNFKSEFTRYKGGSGIGDAEVRRIVRKAGGEYLKELTEDGAKVEVILPLSKLAFLEDGGKDKKTSEELAKVKNFFRHINIRSPLKEFTFDIPGNFNNRESSFRNLFDIKRKAFFDWADGLLRVNSEEVYGKGQKGFLMIPEFSNALGEILKNSYDSIQAKYDPKYQQYFEEENLGRSELDDFQKRIAENQGKIELSLFVEGDLLIAKVKDNGLGKYSADTDFKKMHPYYTGYAGIGSDVISSESDNYILKLDETGAEAVVYFKLDRLRVVEYRQSENKLEPEDGGMNSQDIKAKFKKEREQTQTLEDKLVAIRSIIDSEEVKQKLEQAGAYDFIDSTIGNTQDDRNQPSGFFNHVAQIKKILAGVFETEAKIFRIDSVLLDVQKRIETMAREKGISVKVNNRETIKLNTYKSFLESSIWNLVFNAYRYAFEGKQDVDKTILMDIKSIDDQVEIIVEDNGWGIPEEKLANIWDKEANAAGRYWHFGLPGVKDYVENVLGGTIKVESTFGGGSRFIIQIPKENLGLNDRGKEIISSQTEPNNFTPSLADKRHDIKNFAFGISGYLKSIKEEISLAGIEDAVLFQKIDEVYTLADSLGNSLTEDGGIIEKLLLAKQQKESIKNSLDKLSDSLTNPAIVEKFKQSGSFEVINSFFGTKNNENGNGVFNQFYRIENALNASFETSLRKFSLNDLIKEIQKKYNLENGIKITFENESDIQIDSQYSYLEKVLENIVFNAVKYSDPSKTDKFIKISIVQEKDFIVIDINDNGLGIASEKIELIKKGVLIEQQTNEKIVDGKFSSAFGLDAVKKYLDNILVGSWEIESVVGQGSSFKILLPVFYPGLTEKGQEIIRDSDKENFKNIRHDVNNYLTILIGYLGLISDEVNEQELTQEEKDKISENIKNIENAGNLLIDALKEDGGDNDSLENFTKDEVVFWSNQIFFGDVKIGLELPSDITQEELNILGRDFKTAALNKILAVGNFENRSRLDKLVSIFGLGVLGVSAISGLILPPIGAILNWQQYFHYDFEKIDYAKLGLSQNAALEFNEVALDPQGPFDSNLSAFQELTIYYLEPTQDDVVRRHAVVGVVNEAGVPSYLSAEYVYGGAKDNSILPFVKSNTPILFVFSTIPEEIAYELKLNLVPQDQERYIVAYSVDYLVEGDYSLAKYQQNREKIWNYVAATIQYDPVIAANAQNPKNSFLADVFISQPTVGTKMPSELLIEKSPAICVDYSRLTAALENHLLWMTFKSQQKNKYSLNNYLEDEQIYFTMANYSHPVYAEYAASAIQVAPPVVALAGMLGMVSLPVIFFVKAASRFLERVKNKNPEQSELMPGDQVSLEWDDIVVGDGGKEDWIKNKIQDIKLELQNEIKAVWLIDRISNVEIKYDQVDLDGEKIDVFIMPEDLMIILNAENHGVTTEAGIHDKNLNLKGLYLRDSNSILISGFTFKQVKEGNDLYSNFVYHENTHKKYEQINPANGSWEQMYIDEWIAWMSADTKYTALEGKFFSIIPLMIGMNLSSKAYGNRLAMENHKIGYVLHNYALTHSKSQTMTLMRECMVENTFSGFLRRINPEYEALLLKDYPQNNINLNRLFAKISPEVSQFRANKYWQSKNERQINEEKGWLSRQISQALDKKDEEKNFYINTNGPITEEIKNKINAYISFAKQDLSVILSIVPDNTDLEHLNERLLVRVKAAPKLPKSVSEVIEVDDGGSAEARRVASLSDGGSAVKNRLGGVDLRKFTISKQQSQNILQELSQKELALTVADLDKQWIQLNNMVTNGIAPSGQRIKEYTAVCVAKGIIDNRRDDLLNCLAGIFRMEEEKNKVTDSALKDTILFLETDNAKFISKNKI